MWKNLTGFHRALTSTQLWARLYRPTSMADLTNALVAMLNQWFNLVFCNISKIRPVSLNQKKPWNFFHVFITFLTATAKNLYPFYSLFKISLPAKKQHHISLIPMFPHWLLVDFLLITKFYSLLSAQWWFASCLCLCHFCMSPPPPLASWFVILSLFPHCKSFSFFFFFLKAFIQYLFLGSSL